jgi:SRSO17 transposase
MTGLFHYGKHNIERMNEQVKDATYHQLHHFISESTWEHKPLLKQLGLDISNLLSKKGGLKGLVIDEEGHEKKGKHSVGVGRQYLGSIGKVDNGQVSVFAALNQGDDVGMVNTKLFLPQEWVNDSKRCKKAGIPPEAQVFKTKWELALDMIDELDDNLSYNWINGDGFYGNSQGFRQGLSTRGKFFVLDIHNDQNVYLTHPQASIPEATNTRGRKPSIAISEHTPLKVKDIFDKLEEKDWKTYTFREGTKGAMTRKVYTQKIFLWNTKSNDPNLVEELTLIISCLKDGSEVKFSVANDSNIEVSNGLLHPKLTDSALLFRQMNRYWVERAIQDCKDTIGMTDYQVRTYMAFFHHITLTIMALHYMLIQKIENQDKIPLLSCPDIKFFLAMTLKKKVETENQVFDLILNRHRQRQTDIDRYKIKVAK